MGIADLMKRIDARIDRSRIGDVLVLPGVTLNGHFFNQPREILLKNGDVQGVTISFDCQYVDAIGKLTANDPAEVEGHGSFRFLREVQPGGDESGMTTIELGTIK